MARQRMAAVTGAMLVAALLFAGCSDEGAVSTIPTNPPTTPPDTIEPTVVTDATDSPDSSGSSVGSSTTDVAPTTSGPATTSGPPTTSSPAVEEEQLRADVERDFLRNSEILSGITQRPMSKGLRTHLGEAVVRSSDYYDYLLGIYRRMIANRQRIELGDPPVHERTVEQVEFSGDPPFIKAMVTYCDVSNGELVRVGRNGEVTIVGPPQGLAATRTVVPVRLAGDRWKLYRRVDSAIGYWEGRRSCPDD